MSDDDDLFTLIMLFTGLGGFGIFSAATLLAPVQTWLIETGILLKANGLLVELPWAPGVGLDLGRCIVGGCVFILLLVLVVWASARLRTDDK